MEFRPAPLLPAIVGGIAGALLFGWGFAALVARWVSALPPDAQSGASQSPILGALLGLAAGAALGAWLGLFVGRRMASSSNPAPASDDGERGPG
jgi:hypothetical protein